MLERLSGIKMLSVPYKGGAQAVTDVLAGNVSIYFSGIPPAIQHVKAGKLTALGVAQPRPVSSLPNVPPLATGALARLDLTAWFAFFVPKGRPTTSSPCSTRGCARFSTRPRCRRDSSTPVSSRVDVGRPVRAVRRERAREIRPVHQRARDPG
jgi:hypothetical protein